MSDWWNRFKTAVLWLVIWFSLGFLVYFVVQRGVLRSARFADILQLPIDHAIPFWPGFVWIYITLWIVMTFPFFIYVMTKHLDQTEALLSAAREKIGFRYRLRIRILAKLREWAEFIFGYEPDERRVRKVRGQILLAYFLVISALALSHYFFPLKVERPQLDPVTLTLWVLAQIYYLDAPTSIFPSLHASFAFLVFFIFNRLRSEPKVFSGKFYGRYPRLFVVSKVGRIFLIWAILIVFSMHFVKQHLVMDGIAGFFLAYAAYRAAFSEKVWAFLSRFLPTIFPQI